MSPVELDKGRGFHQRRCFPKQHAIFTGGLASGSFVLQIQLIEFVRDGFNINQFA